MIPSSTTAAWVSKSATPAVAERCFLSLDHVVCFTDTAYQHDKQSKPKHGDPYGQQRHDHRYGLLFMRQGVERGG